MSYNFDKDQNHYFFKNNNSIPLVFIHGVGLNQGMWQPQISYFKDETILTYDLLGHGKTKYNKKNGRFFLPGGNISQKICKKCFKKNLKFCFALSSWLKQYQTVFF